MEKWGNAELTDKIINACISVHIELGPGFLENIYHNALLIEMKKQGIVFESEKEVTVSYCASQVGIHKIDMFIEDLRWTHAASFLPFASHFPTFPQ